MSDVARVEDRALVVHRDLLGEITDLLPPGTEMRVKSLMHLVTKQDSGEELRAPGFGIYLRIGTAPSNVSRDDMAAILDALEAKGHPFTESREALLNVLDGTPHIQMVKAHRDEAARRNRAARRVLAVLHANFSQEIEDVPIGRAMLACRDMVDAVLDSDDDPLRSPS